jgi:adenylylsulfate kinase
MAWAIWITGLPGSGKTTVAREVADMLNGEKLWTLQLDEIRTIVTPRPTFSEQERDIVYAFLAYAAMVLTECGVNVIIDATANRKRYRDLARRLIPRFIEVYVSCSLETCRQREAHRSAEFTPKKIYEKSKAPEAAVPGVNVPYETTKNPELTVDSERVAPKEAAEIIVQEIKRRFNGN